MAENAYNASKEAQETAQTEYNDASSDLTKKNEAYSTAEQNLQKANNEKTAAEKLVSDKQSAKESLEADYNAAVSAKSAGSPGFFNSIGATQATDVFSSCTYSSYIKVGDEKDATSLSNMAKTFTYMKELNDIRKSLGLGELKVTSTLMAYAQADVDYSDVNTSHAQQFNVGENLAWNYGTDPYIQWYTNEKKFFDEAAESLGQTTELTGKAALEYYNNNKTDIDAYVKSKYNKSVGHYINDIRDTYTVTGFAISDRGTKYGYTYGQVFYYSSSETKYTVAEYETMFNDYLEDIETKINNYNTACSELEAAESSLETATTNLTQKEQEFNEAKSARTQAEETFNAKESALETANNDFTEKKAARTNAINEYDLAEEDYQNKKTAYENKGTEKSNLENEISELETEIEGLKTVLEEAITNYNAVKEEYDNRDEMLSQAKENVTTANANKELKAKELDNAITEYENAVTRSEESYKALSAAEAVVALAEQKETEAEQALQTAQKKYDDELAEIVARKEEEKRKSEENSKKEQNTTETQNSQDEKSENNNDESDVKDKSDSSTVITKGSKFVKSGATYKVTKKGKTVEYVKLNSKTAKKATIPATVTYKGIKYKVTSVSAKAFYKHKKLKSITIKSAGISKIGSKAFKGINSKAKIKVPKNKLSKYKKMIKKAGASKKVKITK